MNQWKWLNEEKLYKVYKNGNIYFMITEMNIEHGIELYTNKPTVLIIENMKCEKRHVDEIVYTTFMGKINNACELKHMDKNEQNVNLENLKSVYKNKITTNIPKNWTLIKGYHGKFVANIHGLIKSLTGTQPILKYEKRTTSSGVFNYVYLGTPEKRYFERVDKLIYETFKGKITNEDAIINHKNGDTLDDSIINLQLVIPVIEPDFNIKNFPEWIPVIGYENRYECNGLGELRNKNTGVIMKASKCELHGMYKRVKLRDEKFVQTEFNLHRIIYESFAQKKLDKNIVVDHIDKNKLNNMISNLRAVSQSENASNKTHKKQTTETINSLDDNFTNLKKIDGYDFSEYECNKFGQIRNVSTKKVLHGHVDKGYQIHGLIDKTSKKRITMRAHRIVASVFLPNPNKYDVVHHKNADRTNNHVDNLEWTTQKQNTIYSVGRKVARLDMQGNILKIYDSISLIDDVPTTCHVAEACNGKRNTCAGYKWKYMD